MVKTTVLRYYGNKYGWTMVREIYVDDWIAEFNSAEVPRN